MATMPAIPVKPNTKIQPDQLKIDGDKAPCREALIAVAAYYHAEQRVNGGGDQLSDWLTAESEIDAMQKKPQSHGTESIEGIKVASP